MKKIVRMIYQLGGLWCVVFLGSFLAGLASCSVSSSAGGNPTTIEDAKKIVERETFIGLSKHGIIAFLDKWKWEYDDSNTTGNRISAVIRDARRSGLMIISIGVAFHFDDKGFLQDVSYEEMLTGP
jgi:hypothetical protein